MKARVLVLPIVLALAGCNKQQAKTAEAAPQPYKFPHQMHIESGVACLECHAPIVKSTQLKANVIDVQLPAKNELCLGCHDPVPDYKPVQRFDPDDVRFDHAAHLPRMKGVKDQCQACHKKIAEPGAFKVDIPSMHECTNCHNHAQDFAVGRCTPCHVDLKKYEKPVKEYTHEANFLETHGRWAKQSVATCASCHDQTMCATCHTATTRPMPPSVQFPEKVAAEFIHRGDWISRHAIEQAADPTSCTKCHGTGYCQSCHSFQGVAPGGASLRDPHPTNWILQHGAAARQNILSCAGCHDQGAQSACVACHRSGGRNPHPPGWKGTQQQISANPMCKVCHQ